MVELRILGSPSLVVRGGHDVRSVVQQPKRLTLLSYLTVMSCGSHVRRDKLLGLFWPQSTEKKARSSLSEALSRLRTSLGDGVIVTRGSDEVGVAADGISCDAIDFKHAIEVKEWSVAAELYRGPLLDGLVIDGLHDLEQWLALQRAHFARTALDALGDLSDAAIARGDATARTWAERAFQLDPFDGAAARRVMRVLASSGHGSAALDVYEDFEVRLRDERGMEPSPETANLIHRIKTGKLDAGLRVNRESEDGAVAKGLAVATVSARDSLVGVPESTRKRWGLPSLGVATAAAGLLLFVIGVPWRPDPGPTVLRYSLALPDSERLAPYELRPRLALSPDGSRLLYVAARPEGTKLLLRQRDQLHAVVLPGTDRASNPFFSPDGRRFGYLRSGPPTTTQAIMVASLDGSAPTTVLDAEVGLAGASWGDDGHIYYDGVTGGGTTGVMRVPVQGGAPAQVTVVDTAQGETDHVWPAVLPAAKGLLFTILRRTGLGDADVAVVDLQTGEKRVLVRGVTAKYAESGHLLFVRADGSLAAAPFDVNRLELSGEPVDVTDGVNWRLNGATDLALSKSGTLAYVHGAQASDPMELNWVDRIGHIEPLEPGWFRDFSTLALSDDGARLAVSILPANYGEVQELYIKELPRGPLSRLTLEGRVQNHQPTWSSDGLSVTFVSDRAGQLDVYNRRADGTTPARMLLDGVHAITDAILSPGGEWLVYVEDDDIFATRVGRESGAHALVATSAVESLPAISYDGRWLAYTSDESGQEEVYVSPFPNVGDSRRGVSIGGGFGPQWAHSGEEIFYKTSAGDLISTEVRTAERLEIGESSVIFSVQNSIGGGVVETTPSHRTTRAF